VTSPPPPVTGSDADRARQAAEAALPGWKVVSVSLFTRLRLLIERIPLVRRLVVKQADAVSPELQALQLRYGVPADQTTSLDVAHAPQAFTLLMQPQQPRPDLPASVQVLVFDGNVLLQSSNS
jgi:hypothetical protein